MAHADALQSSQRLREGVNGLLGEVGGLLADLMEAPQGEHDESRLVIDEQLQHFWQRFYSLQERHKENALSVAVLALTKSGKSTLLNALLGFECLPVNNVPETARICRITHDPAAPEPCLLDPASGRTLARGAAAVRARLAELNGEARSRSGPLERALSDEALLHISAPLQGLEGYGAGLGRVTLLDTPGPNEAGEEQLKHLVERLLEGVDAVLYVLDYTKLKTAEEEGLFKRLKAINPQLVARLSSRLFFVINKVDTCETSEGLDPDEVRTYVSQLVTRQLGGEGFSLPPDQVLLLSARNALLGRLVLAGRAGPEAMKRFSRVAFGFAAGGGGGGTRVGGAGAGPSHEQVRAAAGALLDDSGILELESRVLTFLAVHANSVKQLATVDDIVRLLGQVRNVAVTCRGCLQRNVAALEAEACKLRAELGEALEAFDAVMAQADMLQAQVVAEIRTHLNVLRGRLFTHIIQTLDADTRPPPPTPAAAAAAASTSAGAGASAGGAPSRWHRAREKFLSMFTTPGACGAAAAAAGACGGGSSVPFAARSRSVEELKALLTDLHDDLMGQIHAEVADFWGVLEASAAGKNSILVGQLNEHLAALSRRVEGAVAASLQVELLPADISLRPPSREQFHSNLQELISRGIRETQEKHIRVGARTTQERVQVQGGSGGHPSLCRWGSYWTTVPRTRTVVETYTATIYQLRPDEIANHFIQLVDGAVAASERSLAGYVGAFVAAQLADAKRRIEEYSDRYLGAMSSALEASHRGADHRAAALAQVERYVARLEELVVVARQLQRDAERDMPLLLDVEAYEEVCSEDAASEVGEGDAEAAAAAVVAGQGQCQEAEPEREEAEPERDIESGGCGELLRSAAAAAEPAGEQEEEMGTGAVSPSVAAVARAMEAALQVGRSGDVARAVEQALRAFRCEDGVEAVAGGGGGAGSGSDQGVWAEEGGGGGELPSSAVLLQPSAAAAMDIDMLLFGVPMGSAATAPLEPQAPAAAGWEQQHEAAAQGTGGMGGCSASGSESYQDVASLDSLEAADATAAATTADRQQELDQALGSEEEEAPELEALLLQQGEGQGSEPQEAGQAVAVKQQEEGPSADEAAGDVSLEGVPAVAVAEQPQPAEAEAAAGAAEEAAEEEGKAEAAALQGLAVPLLGGDNVGEAVPDITYADLPFDYAQGFLRAMSGSQAGEALGLALSGTLPRMAMSREEGEGSLEEAAGSGGRPASAGSGGGGGGGGGIEDWQLVAEDEAREGRGQINGGTLA